MSKKQRILVIIFCLILLLSLAFLNRDILHFNYFQPNSREFTPADFEKGEYLLANDEISLKAGDYNIHFNGKTEGPGTGFYLIDSDNEVVFASDFPLGEFAVDTAFTVEGAPRQLRVGVRYDPASPLLRIENFSISSENVLYRDSLLRHAVLSLCLILLLAVLCMRFVFTETWRSRFPRISQPEFERTFVFILALTFFTAWPFMGSRDYVLADDMQFHLSRIEGIAASLRAGQFPARIHLFVLQNYGYGAGFFYPDLLLYFPALLRLCGFTIMSVYKFYVVLCSFLSFCSIYYVTRRISRSRFAGISAVVFFAFAAYRLIDVFYRGALGEIQAFIFIPLIVLGLYEIFSGSPQHWLFFALGFCGLVCSHLISLMIVGCVTAVFLLFNNVKIIRDRQIFMALLKSVLLTLGFGAFFILPMIEQSLTNEVTANLLLSTLPGEITLSRVLEPRYLLSFFEIWKDEVVYPGWPFLLIIVLRLVLFIRNRFVSQNQNDGSDPAKVKEKDVSAIAADIILLFGVIAVLMSTRLFPWQWLVWFFNRIQFSWRLMLIATALLPIAGGIIFSSLIKDGKWRLPALTVLFCFCLLCAEPILYETSQNRTVYDVNFVLQNNRVGGGEYLPRWLSVEAIDKTRDTVSSDQPGMQITSHDRSGLSFSFAYDLPEGIDECSFSVPLIAYTGYKAEYTSPDGVSEALEIGKNGWGLVQVSVKGHTEGTIRVWYQKTLTQVISEIISLLTVTGFVFYSWRKKKSGDH